jgi:hypothetical protein
MQLKKRSPAELRLGLMAATCALLVQSAHGQEATDTTADGEKPLQIDTGALYYKENAGRIQSYDAIVTVRKDFGDEYILGLNAAYDSLSGGSPTGAIPNRAAQTFATPSGTSLKAATGAPITYTTASGRTVAQLSKVSVYTAAPGTLPIDSGFHDQRVAGDISWSQPLGQNNKIAVGGHLSHEEDFRSASANVSFSRDFYSKNTTLGISASTEFDNVNPVGGIPLAGSDYTQLQKGGDRTKQVTGGQLGLTQVLARNWITQFNISYDSSSGYLTDPYKIVSVLDSKGTVTGYRFESRPESRARRSIYMGNKVAIGSSVLDLSLRHGTDDWGINNDTIDARYRFNLGSDDLYIEPHLRYYQQSAADFYHLYVSSPGVLPSYLSADPRLAAFTARTIGFKIGVKLQDQDEVSVRVEAYQQDAKVRSSTLTGLSGLDLNPSLQSFICQLNWRFSY